MKSFDREAFMAGIDLPEGARVLVRSTHIPPAEVSAWSALLDTDEDAFLKRLEQKADHAAWALCFFVAVAGKTFQRYQERQIEETLFFNSLSDISLWCRDYFREHGAYGLSEVSWIAKTMKLRLFRLGRIQFEPQVLQNALVGEKYSFPQGTEYLYVHIPAGSSLLHEDCLHAFQWANSFFDPKYKLYFCESWLLSPALKEILPPSSNVLRFQDFFEIIGVDDTNLQAETRIFGSFLQSKERYPENTSLQKCAKRFLLSGRKIGVGTGMRLRTPLS